MKTVLWMLYTGISLSVHGQAIICSDADRQAFEKKVTELERLRQPSLGDTLVAVGKTFLGTPYVAQTLEIGETESLVVNLHGMDCTTFVENVLAFSLLLKNGNPATFAGFTSMLLHIRYRDGILEGYPSRLHYFSEWIANNEKKGLVKDLSHELGGISINKDIDFMSTHRDLYPFLADASNYEKVQASERELNQREICYLPRESIEETEPLLQSGDIIALTTSIQGLDVTHTGIASREADGRIYLLHASTSGQVTLSEQPLSDYLRDIKKNTGIMVARPL